MPDPVGKSRRQTSKDRTALSNGATGNIRNNMLPIRLIA
jgi:hypothetical protein